MKKILAEHYKYHTANSRGVEKALDAIEAHLRTAIAIKDHKTEQVLLPLYILMIGASAEARLNKIIHEPKALDETNIEKIINISNHLDRWHEVLDISFRRAFGLNPRTKITKNSITFDDYSKYEELRSLLDDELKIVIELRNKVAHGQWEYPFTKSLKDISTEHKRRFSLENYLTLKFKRTLINSLLFMIRDLVVSYSTLKRDFNGHYNKIKYARLNIKNRSYEKYQMSLVKKRERGFKKRGEKVKQL